MFWQSKCHANDVIWTKDNLFHQSPDFAFVIAFLSMLATVITKNMHQYRSFELSKKRYLHQKIVIEIDQAKCELE